MSLHAAVALLDLPDELVLHAALQCDDVADVARLARTCRLLNTLIRDTDHFWSLMLARHFDAHDHEATPAAPRTRGENASCVCAADHRSAFRERMTPLTWMWPAYSDGHIDYARARPDDHTVVWIREAQDGAVDSLRSAYTEQPLAPSGLSVFRLLMHAADGFVSAFGLLAADCVDRGDWDEYVPADDVLRCFVRSRQDDACALFFQPHWSHWSRTADTVSGKLVHASADWPQRTWRSGESIVMAVDANRGRVYFALGGTRHWHIAFDDARLAHRSNLRAYVTLTVTGSWARIERVRVTDDVRARLRALDDEYEAVRCAGE